MKWLTHLHQGQNEWRVQQIRKNDRENRKKCYEGLIEGYYLDENFQGERGTDQSIYQINGQLSMAEAPKKTQEYSLQ